MDTNDGGLNHNPGSAKRVRELLSQLQKVILSSVVTDDVQCLEDAIKVYDEYKSLFDVSNDRTSLGLLNFFPEQIAVKVRKEYHCHTPLMIACEKDNEAIIEKLLDNGASVAQKNKYGLTAAHIVCNQGNLSIFRKILSVAEKQKIFCSTKSSVGRVFSSDREVVLMTRAKKGWYPVMFAVKKGNVELLKECFQDEHLSVTSKKKKTVLHIAARAAHLNCLEELMPRVTDDIKKATDKNGWNVIHHACASGSLEVLQWLVENIRSLDSNMLNQKSKCYYTPLLTACEYKKVNIVKYLLSLTDVDIAVVATSELSDIETTDESRQRGRTALHIAAAHNSAEIVGMLIEKKCPLSIQDNKGDTALHYAYGRSSTEVINILELLDVEGVSLKDIRNEEGYLPSEIKPLEVIPLEIRRRGEEAIEIYKRVLKKGSQKLPRCNLLILGEEYVGKTSLYRLLVSKGFDENQISTRGIDDNEVDIVDERSITMGDEWEEKPRENQEEQVIKKYTDGVTENFHKELPPEKTDKGSVVRETVLLEHELSEELKRIRKKLKMYSNEPEASVETKKDVPPSQPLIRHTAEHVTKPQQPRYEKQPQPVHKVPPIEKYVQPSISYKKENKESSMAQDLRQRDGDSLNPLTPSEKSKSVTAPKPPHKKSAPKKEVKSPNISRQECERINKRLKDKKKQHKREAQEPPKLELKALDFAGQKQYRSMHHCFITRRAMYFVVFNLQKVIEYIEAKESSSLPNPIEQIRYWLYSIHAHVFPPEEGDDLRRVCLVGTHRCPPGKRYISDEEIKIIDKRLRAEFGDDDRCINLFHYMGSSRPKIIFAAVENSIDGKTEGDRDKSGALFLQKELKVVSKQLSFLEELHPLIWLKFEQKLIKMREGLIQMKLPLFVTVEEVKKVAENQGIDNDKSCELALNFFHDTGKIVYLKRVPTLYLDDDERNELAKLIILDPAWLSKVMRVVVELEPSEFDGDRKPASRLVKEGIASKSLLMKLWKEFLPETVNEEQSFHHLCTILKAYCLIYPLNDSTVSNSEDRKEESLLRSESVNAKFSTPDSTVLTSTDGIEELPLSSESQQNKSPVADSTVLTSTDRKEELPLSSESQQNKSPVADSTVLTSTDRKEELPLSSESQQNKSPVADSTVLTSTDGKEELPLSSESQQNKSPVADSTVLTSTDGKEELPLSSESQQNKSPVADSTVLTSTDGKEELPLSSESQQNKSPVADSTVLTSTDGKEELPLSSESQKNKSPVADSTVLTSTDGKEELPLSSESQQNKSPVADSTVLTLTDGKEKLPLSSESSNTELSMPEKQTTTSNDLFLVPCILPEVIEGREDGNNLDWVTFFFDFEKFLPEVIFHRFICQLIAVFQQNTSSRRRYPPQFSRTWCRFNNIHDCNWKIELLVDLHRLKISLLTNETGNLSHHIDYIHENYLSKICNKSEFQGLKYHGGPIAKCNCLDSEKIVLDYVSFTMEEESDRAAASDTSSVSKKVVTCEKCRTPQDVDKLLKPSVSSSTDADSAFRNPSLKPSLKLLMRNLKNIAAFWEDLGIELDVDDGKLKCIKTDNHGDCTSCLRELLRTWLNRVDPEPTWEAIAEAVENGTQYQEVASKIRAEYCQ